jgi:hypothetical protein
MKLGLWNRLAVVSAGLTLLATPTWWILSERAEIATSQSSAFRACAAAARENPDQYSIDFCFDTWLGDYWMPGWTEWWQAMGVVAILVAIVYGLIWGAVWLARWIWRGRQVSGHNAQA